MDQAVDHYPQNWDASQQKAISVAEPSFLKEFPNGQAFGTAYEVFSVYQDKQDKAIYTVVYQLPNGPSDTEYVASVDIVQNKVIHAFVGRG